MNDFGFALASMRRGCRVSRSGWNGRGMWIALQVPDPASKMTLPYIFMKTVDGGFVPWLASQTDLLANDWSIVMPDFNVAETIATTSAASSKTTQIPFIVGGTPYLVVAETAAHVLGVASEVLHLTERAWSVFEIRDEAGETPNRDLRIRDLRPGVTLFLNLPVGSGG